MIPLEDIYEIYTQHPNVVIDSRKVCEACLFFGLRGENVDGNQFAEKAIQNGASFAIIDNPVFQKNDQYLLVDNVLKTLQNLAKFHRDTFEIPIIAITGSNGKTTTKELVNAVLNSYYKSHYTKGNFNNHIGLPLTLLAMPKNTEIAVVEMGANHIGEIDFLCRIAQPTHGIITNIGKAHLEGFGSFEGIKKAKSELFQFLSKNEGVAFINLDEPFLKELSEGIPHRIFYQKSKTPSPENTFFETKLISENPFVKVAFLDSDKLIEVQSQIIGNYNFNNIQTAIAVGKYFKVPSNKIKQAIENYVPSNNRSQIIKKETNTFILDAYNANPSSMKEALDNLLKIEGAHKIAILGDMLELGYFSEKEHQDILEYAKKMSFDRLILVGKEFEKTIKKNSEVLYFKEVESLKDWYLKQHFQNTVFLIKGSRALKLEKILQ
jgi:UDP-N-acetylmuramoyl-tripeptide--D-alanyl-D-alanine ligase